MLRPLLARSANRLARFPALALSLLLLLFPAVAPAEVLVGYWNLNGTGDARYDRSEGFSGELDGLLGTIGIGSIRSGTGTLLNATPDTPAGESVQFHEFAAAVVVGYLELTELNFTDLTQPTLSFAYKKEAIVSLFDRFWLEYRTTSSGSNWIKVADIPEPGTSYGDTPYSYTFAAGVLDGLESASIRIHFREAVDFDSSIDFDNIKVTAIPEPGSVVLMGAGLLLAGAAMRRRSRIG